MAFRKRVMTTAALLIISGLILGCSSDTAVTPVTPTPTDEAPLIAPSSVTMTRMANGDIQLAWLPNTQAQLKGYNVYRKSSADFEIRLLTVDPITANGYLDTDTEPGLLYKYSVAAINVKNVESAYTSVSICLGCPSGKNGPVIKQ